MHHGHVKGREWQHLSALLPFQPPPVFSALPLLLLLFSQSRSISRRVMEVVQRQQRKTVSMGLFSSGEIEVKAVSLGRVMTGTQTLVFYSEYFLCAPSVTAYLLKFNDPFFSLSHEAMKADCLAASCVGVLISSL